MVNVECKECPIRNFCPVYNKPIEREDVFYSECPLVKLVEKEMEEEVL